MSWWRWPTVGYIGLAAVIVLAGTFMTIVVVTSPSSSAPKPIDAAISIPMMLPSTDVSTLTTPITSPNSIIATATTTPVHSSSRITTAPAPSTVTITALPPLTTHAAPPPRTSSQSRPPAGPYLARGYVKADPYECRTNSRYDGHIWVTDDWVQYDVVLDVFGPTEATRWFLQNDIQNASYHAVATIPGGVELTFEVTARVYGPDYAPSHISGEMFVYDHDANAQEFNLRYANGGPTITRSDCHLT
jgi:hypothetical protein